MNEALRRTKDGEAVERALDRLISRDPTLRRFTKRMLRAQRDLHEVASKKAWLRYLTVEEWSNARDTLIIDAVIQLALRRGRRGR